MSPVDLMALTVIEPELFALCCSVEAWGAIAGRTLRSDFWRAVAAGCYHLSP